MASPTPEDNWLDAFLSSPKADAALALLNASPAAGPDGVSYCAIFHLEDWAHLFYYFNQSWKTGVVPPARKVSRITPSPIPGKPLISNILSFDRPSELSRDTNRAYDSCSIGIVFGYQQRSPECMLVLRRGRSPFDTAIDLAFSIEQHRTEKRIMRAGFLDIMAAFDNVTYDTISTALEGPGIGGC